MPRGNAGLEILQTINQTEMKERNILSQWRVKVQCKGNWDNSLWPWEINW